MKKKLKTRNIVMTALLSVALLGCVLAVIWKLIPEGKKFSAFAYDYSTPMKEFGDGITIDGKLDETLWKNQRVFEADIKDTTVTYQMTSYFGKSGVYFAFDIQDDAVYYNEGRAIYANSGVEFCVGSPDNTELAYEIDLNAGGNTMLRKYNGKRYNDWFSDLNSAVRVDGEINTSECKGYSVELYLPYSLFNEENQDIPIDELLVNPGIVRASSADPLSTDRLWYSIGFEERGLDWMPSSQNWYHFDKDGIVARDVVFEKSTGGSFDGKKIAFENEIYEFGILPDKNYRYADVTVEGSSVIDNVLFRDGVVYGRKTIEEAKDDTPVVVSAKWVPLSNTKYTISGTVVTEEGNVPADAKLYAVYNGYVEEIKIEKDGSYSALLPEGDYILYCECNGYMREKKAVSLYQDTSAAIVLRKVFLSDEKNAWDLLDLGSGTVICTKSSWSVSAWHNTLKGNYLYTASDVILPMKEGIDRRIGYSFRDGDKTITVCLVAEDEKNQERYSVQVIYFDGTKSHWLKSVDTLNKDVASLANDEGVPFAVLYDNGKLTVWVNHSRVMYEYDVTTHKNWTGWKADTKVVPGITGYSAKDAVLNNLRFNTTGYDGPVSLLDKWVLSGADAYDISNIEKGVIVYTANAPSSATESDLMLNFTANANDDIYVETVVKKGKNFNMADLRMGFDFAGLKLTLRSSEKSGLELQITNWKFWDAYYRLNDAQKEAFEGEGIRIGAARIDGVFYMYIQDGNGMDRVITKEYTSLANAVIHPSIATWGGANDAVYSNFVCRVGDNVEPAVPTVPYPVINGLEYYDVSAFSKGKAVYIYTGSGSKTLELNAPVEAEDDVYVETVLKKGKKFDMTDLRLGFTLGKLNMTLISNKKSGIELQMTDWKFYESYKLNDAQVEAFEGAGLRVGAARINGVYYMYVQDGNGMDCVVTKAAADYATASFNIKLATWESAQGAIYSGLSWKIGRDVEPAAPTVPYPVLNGIHDYDVSDLSNGNVTYTYTGSGSKTLEFNAAVGAEDDVYAETILKKGENFDMTDLRLGFAFGKVNLTLLSNTKSGIELQMTDWKFYQAYKLNDVQVEAFENEGLKVGAARINGIYYMYVQNGDGMDRVVIKEAADYANASFNIKLATWENAQGAVYSGLNWKIGKDVEPAAPTTPYPVLNGIHYYDVSDLSNGNVTYIYTGSGDKALELNAPVGAQDDVYVEAVLKKGENFNMSDLRLGFRFGSLNLDVVSTAKNGVQLQMNNWIEFAYYNFTNAQKEAFEGKGLKVGAARVDGKFRMYIENGNGMDCVLEKEYNAYANSPFNIKLATWDSAKGAVYSGINWKVGENVEPKPSTLVLGGEENYDITNIQNGTVTYTGSGEQVLELNAAVGANDDVYVETVMKKGEDFNMSNLRLGFRFSNLNLDLVSSTENGLQLQMTNWKEHAYYDFTDEQKQAFEGDGLKIGAARFHGKFYMFIENGNGMECVLEKEYATYAKSSFNVKLVTWTEAKGAVYNNLNWEIGGNTKTESEKYDSSKFDTTTQETKWINNGNAGKTTVFIGDSFFDEYWFFKTFSTLYQGKDALCIGVGSTTTYDWIDYANGWLGDVQPKNLVVNIGTNNIYDDKDLTMETVMALQDMFEVLKNKMPNTTFYWFSISQRKDTAYADRVTSTNAIMKAWCNENNIVYVETPLVDPATQTSDGLHPSTACYEQYKLALENAGCVIDAKTTSSIPVISGATYYEIKDRNVTYTYTGSGDKALELDAAVGASDDVYVEAVLKKGENFNMSDLRYGFRFSSLNLNVVSSTKNGLQLQLCAWDKRYPSYNFTEAQKTAFEGDGLKIGAARIGGKFYMYIENGNGMDCVLEEEYSNYANSAFNIKLATWPSAQGAVYSGLKWKIGKDVAP